MRNGQQVGFTNRFWADEFSPLAPGGVLDDDNHAYGYFDAAVSADVGGGQDINPEGAV